MESSLVKTERSSGRIKGGSSAPVPTPVPSGVLGLVPGGHVTHVHSQPTIAPSLTPLVPTVAPVLMSASGDAGSVAGQILVAPIPTQTSTGSSSSVTIQNIVASIGRVLKGQCVLVCSFVCTREWIAQ